MGAQVVVFGVDETPYYPFVLRGGTPVIKESGNGVNLTLADGNVIRVAGKLQAGARIGVTASDAPRSFTSNYSFQNYDELPSAYFFSDENVVIPGMLATFTIGFGAEEDIEKVPDNQLPGTKIIENGVLYLLYQGTKYDVRGNRVR